MINEINYSSNVPLFVCFFKCKLTHTKLICFRCVVLNKNNILFLFYMLYKFGRACSHSELMKKNLWNKINKSFLSILFISRPNTIWLTIVFWRDLMISPHIIQNGFILNHMSIFFKKSIFRLPVLDWIMTLKMLFPHTTICYNNICKDFLLTWKRYKYAEVKR